MNSYLTMILSNMAAAVLASCIVTVVAICVFATIMERFNAPDVQIAKDQMMTILSMRIKP